MTTTVALIALFVLCIGFAMLIANPSRFTNQIFAVGSLLVSIELFTIYRSIEAGHQFQFDETNRPLLWLRASGFFAPLFPWILWLLIESITSNGICRKRILVNSIAILAPSLFFSCLSLTDWYIPSTSTPINIIYGPAYYLQSSALIISYALLTIRSLSMLGNQSGVRRLELQLLAFNLSITAVASISLLIAGNLSGVYIYKQSAIILILFSFSLTAGTIAAYRVFTLPQIFISGAQAIIVGSGFYLLIRTTVRASNPTLRLPLETEIFICITCLALSSIDRISRRQLGLDGARSNEFLRKNAIGIAKTEAHWDRLVAQLEELLRANFNTSQSSFLFEEGKAYRCSTLVIDKSNSSFSALNAIGWATPESLDRRRQTPALQELSDLMGRNGLGLVITVPRGSTEPSLLLALGTKTSKVPYTYPEILRIQEIAELMDNLLIRSKLSAQLELQNRIENMAVMSRGLAHDLKNLITPVSTFLNTYELQQQPSPSENPVYAAARRSMRVITDYVEEAHFFSKQLIPRLEPVNPCNLLRDVAAALQGKAERVCVFLEIGPATQETIMADRVLLQRLVSNLVDNAIDASAAGSRVSLQVQPNSEGQIKFSVVDSGSGISPEILPRIFEPYFTTKDLGTGVRGFGLGLAICQKIVEIHGGTLGVRTAVGAGTTFDVLLPVGDVLRRPVPNSISAMPTPCAATALA